MSKLNLEDRQSWQRFQRILTSFLSDYIDLLAPEQAEIRFDQGTLSLGFTLLSTSLDEEQVNLFIHQLEQFLKRLPLVGVRHAEFIFCSITDGDPLLVHRFPIEFLSPDRAIVSTTNRPQSRRRSGSLVRRLQGWLTSPQLGAVVQSVSKAVIRNPKGAMIATGDFTQRKFDQALTWVDTFPWEEWAKQKAQWQQRRHSRNPIKALVEDAIFIALIALLVVFGGSLLSGPSLNLAALPAQHYDSAFANGRYSCGGAGVNRKNYVCLQRGMSYNQVKQILGGEGKSLGIDPKFGKDSKEAKKLLTQPQQANFWAFFQRKRSLGEQVAVVDSWSDGKGGTLNCTFLGNTLVARAYRGIS